MIGLVRAEWTKLFTTRLWIGLLLAACLLAGGPAALVTGGAGGGESDGAIPPIGSPVYEQFALSQASNASVLLLILGIIGMTQEYRHRTATPTFLTTPRRGAVITAKMVAYALVAVPFAVVILAVTVAVVEIYAGARGSAPSLTGDNLQTLLSAGLVLIVYTVIGVGVGALVRNQIGAIIGSLVYLFVLEPILANVPATEGAYKFLPGGAAQAITSDFQAPDLLDPWQGALLLVAYGVVAAVLGGLFAVRRDIV